MNKQKGTSWVYIPLHLLIFILLTNFFKEISSILALIAGIITPIYFLFLLSEKIQDQYKRKIVPWLHARRLKREFANPASRFYGWKYDLLVPARYVPWHDALKMHSISKKNWVPKRELCFTEVVLSDKDIRNFHWFEENAGCNHDNFITLQCCRDKKFRDLNYKDEGLLHICLQCQQQIGYDGIGMN